MVRLSSLLENSYAGFTGSRGDVGFTGSRGDILWSRQTANYTIAIGEAVIADTTAGSFVITLPVSPNLGGTVTITDGGDWSINSITVGRNGSTIENQSQDYVSSTKNGRLDFVHDGITWQVYSSGGDQLTEQEIITTTTSMAIAFG